MREFGASLTTKPRSESVMPHRIRSTPRQVGPNVLELDFQEIGQSSTQCVTADINKTNSKFSVQIRTCVEN